MIDIGWQELLIVGVVLILVVGPKDLPRAIYKFGQWVGYLRRSMNSIQRHINMAAHQSEFMAQINPMTPLSDQPPDKKAHADERVASASASSQDTIKDKTPPPPSSHSGQENPTQAAAPSVANLESAPSRPKQTTDG
ncbi:MAG: Sec-independent protein translocase protein TatB [Pseudomonadota bacterium]